jgi:fructose-bisphosphate aldolase class I
MDKVALKEIAEKLVSKNKGILAADESTGTITKRFKSVGLTSTPELNRKYRQMLFSTPKIEEFISGVIMFDETTKQKNDKGVALPEYLSKKGIIPGIKVDEGKESFRNDKEEVTKGLKGLSKRLFDYKKMGLKFTKWRAVVYINEIYPSKEAILENAKRLAEYAKVSQENGFVPIVEPEILMEGEHTITKCEIITKQALKTVFEELEKKEIFLEGLLLKTNMVLPGKESLVKSEPKEVAQFTLRVLEEAVPEEVPGIVFLSGGQSSEEAIANLNGISKVDGKYPWELSFSFGRALQGATLDAWKGEDNNATMAQEVFYKVARSTSLARQGKYMAEVKE